MARGGSAWGVAEWVLHVDGLYEPRYRPDGVATYGFVVTHGGEVVHEEKGLVAPPGELASSNVAEFGALIQGLTWLRERDLGGCPLVVRGDSRLVVETVAGRWKLSSEVLLLLLPLRDVARRLVAEIGGEGCVVTLEKVPREQIAEADRLSREAYHELVREHPGWGLGRKR